MHGFIFSFYGALLCLSGKVWAPQMKGTSPFSPPMYDHRHLKLIHSAIRGALQSAAILSLQLNAANALAAEQTAPIIVEIDVRKPVATFLPSDVFGAGVDGLGQNGIARTYQPANIQEMNSSGFSRLSYRLRTELGVEAWHWNEEGSWSDPERSQGYWSSSDTAFQPVLISHGYRLPRRGNTIDQANNDGYSRLDDGDEDTLWKSNPYLDPHFTGESRAPDPQWVVVDFGERQAINAMRVLWSEPYAVEYEVQYWRGENSDSLNDLQSGDWHVFPHGHVDTGKGGDVLLRLSDAPIRVRFVRLWLVHASGTASEGARDIRDHLGFAIRELYAGTLEGEEPLRDVLRHGPSNTQQTVIWTSSTDPWHRRIDVDPKTEQPGFDRIMATGLAHGRPMLTPTGLLYDTPENAAAEVRFLEARGYQIHQIELGEEPDGQNVTPEHYAALFIQFADAIHRADPGVVTGGPSLQSEINGWTAIADDKGDRSWMRRFMAFLRARDHLGDFGFFSFEWYPFDDLCEPGNQRLISNPNLMNRLVEHLAADGVPRTIPWIMSEYGYSSFAGQAEVEMPSAVLNAEILAQFLALGGKTAYVYGLEPKLPVRGVDRCDTWGNLTMFLADGDGRAAARMPIYHAAKLLAEEWAERTEEVHTMYQALVGGKGDVARSEISAFAVHRPDGQWAVLLTNESALRPRMITIRFDGATQRRGKWAGPLELFQYSAEQYEWVPHGALGKPLRGEPPKKAHIDAGGSAVIELLAMSLTVVRGVGPTN